MWKLRRRPEPSMLRIKHLESRFLNRLHSTRRNASATPVKRLGLHNRVFDHCRLLDHIPMLLFVSIGNAQQHAPKTRTPVSIVGWKVCTAIKRLSIRRKKRCQGPSALPAHRLHRGLVPAIDIGTLVAIHFDGDKMLIDDGRKLGIVIRLAVHHVTPVAPHCADVEQHRLVLAMRRGESLRSPLMPPDRLMHGGPKISRRSVRQRVKNVRRHDDH